MPMRSLVERSLRVVMTGVVPADDPHIIADMQAEIERARLRSDTFERQYRQACQDHATAIDEIRRLRAALSHR